MLQQTINGKVVIIISIPETGKYLVYYEGKLTEMDERPITDQDGEQLKMEREEARQEIIEIRGRMLGNVFVNMLEPFLNQNRN